MIIIKCLPPSLPKNTSWERKPQWSPPLPGSPFPLHTGRFLHLHHHLPPPTTTTYHLIDGDLPPPSLGLFLGRQELLSFLPPSSLPTSLFAVPHSKKHACVCFQTGPSFPVPILDKNKNKNKRQQTRQGTGGEEAGRAGRQAAGSSDSEAGLAALPVAAVA